MARAATAQYAEFKPIEHIHSLIRTSKQLQKVLRHIEHQPGIVLFTLVSNDLRRELITHCANLSLPCLSILDPILATMAQYLNAPTKPQVAGQYVLNADYFRRMDALHYAMSHDDGQNAGDLHLADVVLLGVSRTSKTPTCIYLAQRGIRAGNIPIIPNIPVPPILYDLQKPLVVGLIATAERIAQIRRHRLLNLNESSVGDYADPRHITQEIMFLKTLCTDHQWPMIDVTRRSVEETAASILNMLTEKIRTSDI